MDENNSQSPKTSVVPNDKDQATTKKIEEARLAMEGIERTEKRLREERLASAGKEIKELENKLAEIEKNKEGLEIEWVKQDDRRQTLKTALKPIAESEKLAEDEEATLELAESQAALPAAKEEVEKKRWTVQDKRRAAEKEKWELQEKLWKIEAIIEENTKKYRALLEEEDKIKSRLDELKNNSVV